MHHSLMVKIGLFILITLTATTGSASTLRPNQIPEPLKPWVEWVLYDHEAFQCPMRYNNHTERLCLWPSRLELTLTKHSGKFIQSIQLIQAHWVPLPGNEEQWPTEVTVNEKPAIVMAHNQTPGIWLSAGTHVIAGSFHYPILPEFLLVPQETALITLTLQGEPLPFAAPDPQGRLWLHSKSHKKPEADQLEMSVHRLLKDGVPVILESRLELRIAGKKREILLDNPLTPTMIPMSLNSPLPIKVEADGRLRIQARPGVWEITQHHRHQGALTEISLPKKGSWPWPQEEIWAFAANHNIRMVSISGVTAIDPQQTRLPNAWRNHPTYRMQPGEPMRLTEKKPENGAITPDRLTLNRTLWLDFSGAGWTVQDKIQGSDIKTWRLEITPPMQLGRVAIDQQNQFITRLGDPPQSGVEIRNATLNLTAESRLPMDHGIIPATGWNHDFHQLSASLQLPPGWRLFHASGVDTIQTTWISQWSLLDLFLVLIIALATSKLWGHAWGVIALCTMILVYPEDNALAWIILTLMAAIALKRLLLDSGMLSRTIQIWRNMTLMLLIITLIPFLVDQIHQGLYPQLEMNHSPLTTNQMDQDPDDVQSSQPHAASLQSQQFESSRAMKRIPQSMRVQDEMPQKRKQLALTDPNSQVQTGPGLPQWQWREVTLRWNGPVLHDQLIQLYLLPPWANRIVILCRILLMLALLGRIMEFTWPRRGITQANLRTTASLLFLLTGLHTALVSTPVAANEIPGPELLETLRTRLLSPPECLPACADLTRLHLEADADTLRLRLEVHALNESAIPLPGKSGHWQAQTVFLDGKPAHHLTRLTQPDPQGTLWMLMPAGIHTITMEGRLPSTEKLQISLPLAPRWATASTSSAWQVAGIHDNGTTDATLQLQRMEAQPKSFNSTETSTTPTNALPPFIEVERRLILGLTWSIETRINRITPTGNAVLLAIPLLPKEAVTSDHIQVVDHQAIARLEPNEQSIQWLSTLEISNTITLQAPEVTLWQEVWHLQAAPIWHIVTDETTTRHQEYADSHQPEWRPWPNEKVTIHISRPQGIAGPTLTLEKSTLNLSPGERSTDVNLILDLRSSRGGQHTIQLPESARLFTTFINGRKESVRQNGRQVILPITPGLQNIKLNWRQSTGLTPFYTTPQPNLGIPGTNATTQLNMPPQRWILWSWGAEMGPAVLYWGSLLLIFIAAIALGRIPWLPLKTYHWILLGLGLSTVDTLAAVTLVSWFLLIGWRGVDKTPISRWSFNLRQIFIIFWTLAALSALGEIFQHGLLGYPDMQIAGNQSTHTLLQWFQDRTDFEPTVGGVLSLPIFAYRLMMLAWSLWLAAAMLNWIRWGWSCFVSNDLWRPRPPTQTPPKSIKPKDVQSTPSEPPTPNLKENVQ